jgi:hypothetical protein
MYAFGTGNCYELLILTIIIYYKTIEYLCLEAQHLTFLQKTAIEFSLRNIIYCIRDRKINNVQKCESYINMP